MIEEKICGKCGLMAPHIRGHCLVCEEIELTESEACEVKFWAERAVYKILGKVRDVENGNDDE